MPPRMRQHLTYANVVSTLCLFILLGGSAVAASRLSGKSIKPRSIPGNRLKNHTITGQQVNLGALGKVPNAGNADSLGGSPASDYRLHCPAGLQQAGDLCFETDLRPSDTWANAMQACALANRRLPTEGELALVFNNSGAPQPNQWTSTAAYSGSQFYSTSLDYDSSRRIGLGAGTSVAGSQYRCVTNARN